MGDIKSEHSGARHFRIAGRVVDKQSNQGIADVRVEAWDKDLIVDDLVGAAITDFAGAFAIEFTEKYFRDLFFDRLPDLFFKVFRGAQLIASTENDVVWNLRQGETHVEVGVPGGGTPVPTPQPPPDPIWKVHGEIRDAQNKPAARLIARAFARDLREESLLGGASTGLDGRYSIAYSGKSFTGDRKRALVVRVYPEGHDEPLASAPMKFDPQPVEEINIGLGGIEYRGAALSERKRAIVGRAIGDIPLHELKTEEVLYTAGRTSESPEDIGFLGAAERYAARTGLPSDFFYALFRQGYPVNLAALLAQKPENLRRAVERAVAANQAPTGLAQTMNEVLGKLPDLAIEHSFLSPDLPEARSMAPIMQRTGLDEGLQRRFLRTHLEHQGTPQEFWDKIAADPAYGGREGVEQIQFTFQLGVLAQNHVPLVDQMRGLTIAGRPVRRMRDLAALNSDDWLGLVRKSGAPAYIEGPDEESRLKEFATVTSNVFELAMATPVIGKRIERDREFPLKARVQVAEFLDRNEKFDFRSSNVDAYLDENPGAIGQDGRQQTLSDLRTVQRMFRLTPPVGKAEAMRPLLAEQITSAAAIRRMGFSAFQKRFEPVIGTTATAQIYANASDRNATAVQIFAHASPAMNRTATYAMRSGAALIEGIPTLESLFGQLELCECEHCKSVYSPAAYMVDILQWLRGRTTRNKTALATFLERRPDVGLIELNCENTNTPLPYIDLVNEVLENALAPAGAAPQTGGTAEQLRVHPERLNEAAYALLNNAPYPWNLPYDLWSNEARLYLSHLGVPRWQLMSILRTPGGAPATIDVAQEHLRLAPVERQILTGSAPFQPQEYWGMSGVNWAASLRMVSRILEQSGLTYVQLTELLETRYINPGGALQVEFPEPDCNIERYVIPNMDEAALSRIHRFVRLQRKLGWKPFELDAAIRALQPNDLTDDFLVRLAEVVELRESMKRVPLATMLGWWEDIDTTIRGEEPSEYDKLFQNRAVSQPNETSFQAFELNAQRTELAAASSPTPPHIPEQAPAILGAFGLREDELSGLVDTELVAPGGDDLLNLANLSALHRAATLAKGLRLRVRDYLALRGLIAINPFSGEPADTRRFSEAAALVKASGFSLDELNYLLRDRVHPNSPVRPGDDRIAGVLNDMRTALQTIHAATEFVADTTGERAVGAMVEAVGLDQAGAMLLLIERTGARSPAEQATDNALVDSVLGPFMDAADARAQLVGTPPAAPGLTDRLARYNYVLQRLLNWRRRTTSETTVKQRLTAELKLPAETVDALVLRLVPSRSQPAPATALADFLALGAPGNQPMIRANFPDAFDSYRLLDKIATLLRKLGVQPGEVEAVYAQGPAMGWLNPGALPLTEIAGAAAQANFTAWSRMAEMAQLRNALPAGEPTLQALLFMPNDGATAFAAYRAAILQKTAWNEADFDFVTGAQGLNLAWPADYSGTETVSRVRQLNEVFATLKRLGVSAATAWGWNTPAVSAAQARDIKQATRSKYTADAWYKVAKPLRDELREQQRAALTGYVISHPYLVRPTLQLNARGEFVRELQQRLNAAAGAGLAVDGIFGALTRNAVNNFKNTNGLPQDGVANVDVWRLLMPAERLRDSTDIYDYFLIDPEMSACMMTSRIKQGISSIQLFTQRSFLNLEPDVELFPGDAREWDWMKTYRVWEANRKIFLYPENWIEAELRDDKSPFFKELENDLRQGEVTQTAVEDAYIEYLEKLDEVSRLHVTGVYHQVESENGKTVLDHYHVVARTRSDPTHWYYRKRVDGAYWTPWEKIDLDIETDQVFPQVYNRRLHLFWPQFKEKPNSSQTKADQNSAGKQPDRHWEIRMAYSERKKGGWTAKKITPDPIISQYSANGTSYLINANVHSFRAFESGGDLIIRCIQDASFPAGTGIVGDFQFTGCGGKVLAIDRKTFGSTIDSSGAIVFNVVGTSPVHKTLSPPGTESQNIGFKEQMAGYPLNLWEGNVYSLPYYIQLSDTLDEVPVLSSTPGTFRLTVPHQDMQFTSQRPFFYQDDNRSFFITPGARWFPIFLGPAISFGEVLQVSDFTVQMLQDPISVIPAGVDTLFQSNYQALVSHRAGRAITAANQRSVGGNSGVVTTGAGGAAAVTALDPVVIIEPTSATAGMALRSGALKLADLENGPAVYSWDTAIAAATNVAPFVGVRFHKIPTYQFDAFFHPYTCLFLKTVRRHGVDGLLAAPPGNPLHRQAINCTYFASRYQPNLTHVSTPYPKDQVDFSYGGSYSSYNWEIFLHGPMYVASRLSTNQKFAEAQKWFHYIFDPTDTSADPVPQRFWKIKPFYEEATGQNIRDLLLLLGQTNLTPEERERKKNLQAQIAAWRKDPFKPHLIARFRQSAYQKWVVMKYLDNLIAWGDQLFGRDTIETINEATQLYILASKILGRRPEKVSLPREVVPVIGGNPVRTYNDLAPHLDEFSNALIDVETNIAANENAPPADDDAPAPQVLGPTLFFCIPKNDKLTNYWNVVEDRLFKIRNCMNIAGQVRMLPLFEPPIDPGMLVRAAASGADIGSLFLMIDATVPPYRFDTMIQRALGFAADVRALGSQLLSALLSQDAARITEIQAGHLIALQESMRATRQMQIDAETRTKEGLELTKEMTEWQRDTLRGRARMNEFEIAHLSLQAAAKVLHMVAGGMQTAAVGLHMIPDIVFGAAGGFSSPVSVIRPPVSTQAASSVEVAAGVVEILAQISDTISLMMLQQAAYSRRQDDWDFQAGLADRQTRQIQKQIDASELRRQMAVEAQLQLELQITQANEVLDFYRTKFTNQELWDWMVTQISTVYFEAYQLALQVAREAERCYRLEIGDYDASFIQMGYWDDLRRGLLSGEKLQYDLRRMEASYLEQNKREYEITKNISLAALDPFAMMELRETGTCQFLVPELVYDLDYAGHYFRRLKTVGLTVVAFRDPATVPVACKLSLLTATIRISDDPNPQYERTDDADPRFRDHFGPVQSIVTSMANNDNGLFQLTFFDQRYLPFEYLGAADSTWRIDLRQDSNNFDVDSIFDVQLNIRYTSRDGGGALETAARDRTSDLMSTSGGVRFFAARILFSTSWAGFVGGSTTLVMDWGRNQFPAQFTGRDVVITRVVMLLKLNNGLTYNDAQPLNFNLSGPGGATFNGNSFQVAGSPVAGVPAREVFSGGSEDPGTWTLTVTAAGQATSDSGPVPVHPGGIEDILILLDYTVS